MVSTYSLRAVTLVSISATPRVSLTPETLLHRITPVSLFVSSQFYLVMRSSCPEVGRKAVVPGEVHHYSDYERPTSQKLTFCSLGCESAFIYLRTAA